MPFTPAHAAVSLPFIRRMRAISVFGLVLGSMAPDFEYFIRLKPMSMGGHAIVGMFLLNLPLCLLLAVLYLNVLEDGLIQLLPEFIAKKWPRFGRSVKSYAIAEWINFIFWTLVGMLTHITWDAFTHSTGMGVQLLPVLNSVIQMGPLEAPVYKFLQHGSTLIGLSALTIHILLRKSRRRMPQPVENLTKLRLIFFGIIVALGLVRFIIFKTPNLDAIGEWVVSLISYSFISWTAISLLIKKNAYRAIQEFLAN